jgi:hypothetical protein
LAGRSTGAEGARAAERLRAIALPITSELIDAARAGADHARVRFATENPHDDDRTLDAASPSWAVIAYNALWSLDSVVLLLSGWVAPNAFGLVFVIGQALVVAVLAECQYMALRRSRAAPRAVAA